MLKVISSAIFLQGPERRNYESAALDRKEQRGRCHVVGLLRAVRRASHYTNAPESDNHILGLPITREGRQGREDQRQLPRACRARCSIGSPQAALLRTAGIAIGGGRAGASF